MNALRLAITIVTCGAITAGCSARSLREIEEEGAVGASHERLYVLTPVLWKDPSNIGVCWEVAGFATEKNWVAEALRASWETAAPRVHFTGFGQCTSASRGVRVTVNSFDQDGPHVVEFGRSLDGVRNGMTLDFEFLSGQFDKCKTSEAMRERCIKAIATHEFGHALGFLHEQERADTPASCPDKQVQTGGGAVALGSWALMSIMNYCYPDRDNVFPTTLSPGDIAGVRQMYPSPDGADAGPRPDATPDAGEREDGGGGGSGTTGGGSGSGGGPRPGGGGEEEPDDDLSGGGLGGGSGSNAATPPSNGSSRGARRASFESTASSSCSAGPGAKTPGSFAALVVAALGLVSARRRRRA